MALFTRICTAGPFHPLFTDVRKQRKHMVPAAAAGGSGPAPWYVTQCMLAWSERSVQVITLAPNADTGALGADVVSGSACIRIARMNIKDTTDGRMQAKSGPVGAGFTSASRRVDDCLDSDTRCDCKYIDEPTSSKLRISTTMLANASCVSSA